MPDLQMKAAISLAIVVLVIATVWGTPLDDYVDAPDPTYDYELIDTIEGLGFVGYVINMTSQTWLSYEQSNHPIWWHWLLICVPDEVTSNKGFLWIDGGSNSPNPPTSFEAVVEGICLSSKTVTSELLLIPNQPIIFANDGIPRSEDDLIAYTWLQFIHNTSQPDWLARLPMTKAAVMALTTIQDFTKGFIHVPPLDGFVVSGASKRGWTAWTTAAVDSRVIAVIPLVIPILNIVPNMNHQWRCYGNWSFALEPYLNEGIMAYLNQWQFEALAAVVDPFSYIPRLTMPKYVICATGDEFFLPDSPQFFFSDLLTEKYLRMVPNAEHSLVGHELDLMFTVETYYYMVIHNISRPRFSWQLIPSNETAQIIVSTIDKPTKVKMWHATTLSAVRRDFRLLTCPSIDCIQPVIWFEKELTDDDGDGVYHATMSPPDKGWTGFFVELEYEISSSIDPIAPMHTLKFSTEVNVVPDVLPFPPCGDHCQPIQDYKSEI